MWLGDSEGRDRAGSEADFKGILRIHSLPDSKESIPVDWFLGLCQDGVAAVAELQARVTVQQRATLPLLSQCKRLEGGALADKAVGRAEALKAKRRKAEFSNMMRL